ncbi:MAG: calcium/sodium antiporter [Geminicoccaceae bacterium]|nr:calcium/sodium antiporter [Geminicoccaceae bacterium]
MLAEFAVKLPLPPVLVWPALLIVSLAILVKASDVFTDAAETIGRIAGLPHFVVGATIVAIGTSLPELVSSVLAVLHGTPEIVAGNVVGSNIANLLVILGLAAVIDGHVRIRHRIALVDLPFLLGSTFLLALVLWDGSVGRVEAVILLSALAVYMHYVLTQTRSDGDGDGEAGATRTGRGGVVRPVLMLLGSALFILAGADGTVTSAIGIGRTLDIGAEIIAASAVAFGTSLPEVSVTVAAARRGNAEMAVGNVLGSNIFNALAVTGISAATGMLVVPASLIGFAVPIMLVATLLVYFIVMQQEMTKWEGALLLLFYVFFIAELFHWI